MLPVPTVFIIGAGAGVDLAMPTGDALCNEIGRKVNIAFEGGTRKVSGDDQTYRELHRLANERRININDLLSAGRRINRGIHYSGSIDNYIHTHKDDELIKICGKLGIVQTIIEHEKNSKLFIDTTRHPFKFRDDEGIRQSWLRRFMLLLQEGIIASENLDSLFKNLLIINFNYDRCLEQFLYWTVQDLFGVDAGRAGKLIQGLKIYHPYGVVAPLPWLERGGLEFGGNPHGDSNYAQLIGNIRTFNEEVEAGDNLRIMQEIFAASRRFVTLGFHFHKQNLELMKPRAMHPGEPIEIFATAYNRSPSDVEVIRKRMGDLFGPKIRYGEQIYGTSLDCRKLFADFGTKLGSA